MNSILCALLSLLIAQQMLAAEPAESGYVDIPPGTFHEPCMDLRRGDTLNYQVNADQPLEFNPHYHPGKKVEYPIPVMLMNEGKGTLKPGSDFAFCPMWENRSEEKVGMRFSWS